MASGGSGGGQTYTSNALHSAAAAHTAPHSVTVFAPWLIAPSQYPAGCGAKPVGHGGSGGTGKPHGLVGSEHGLHARPSQHGPGCGGSGGVHGGVGDGLLQEALTFVNRTNAVSCGPSTYSLQCVTVTCVNVSINKVVCYCVFPKTTFWMSRQ